MSPEATSFCKLFESTDITDVAQLAIFIRGVGETLTVTEEFLELVPMMNKKNSFSL